MEKPETNISEKLKNHYQEHKAISQDIDTFDSLATEWTGKYLKTKVEIDEELKKSKRKRHGDNWLRISMLMESDQMRDASRAQNDLFLAKHKYDQNIAESQEDVKENLDAYIDNALEDARQDGVEIKLDSGRDK